MANTIFHLRGPRGSGKTTLACSMASGICEGVGHLYVVPTEMLARRMSSAHPGVLFSHGKFTPGRVNPGVRVLVLDSDPGLAYSEDELAAISTEMSLQVPGPSQILVLNTTG